MANSPLTRVSPGIYKDAKGNIVKKATGNVGQPPGAPKAKKPTVATPLTPQQQDSVAVQNLLGPDARGAEVLSNNLYSEGSLGRINEERPAAVQDYINRYYSGLEGYAAPELQAMREQGQANVDSQYQTNLAQMAKMAARNGVRGAAAGAQQNNLERARLGEQQNLEQQLFIKNADERQNRLKDYTGALEGARGDEAERRRYNLGQLAAERAGKSGTYFNALNLGLQRQGMADTKELSNKQLEIAKKSARRSGGGGVRQDYNGYAQGLQNASNSIYG